MHGAYAGQRLRETEEARLAAQKAIDQETPTDRRSRLGQFATPPELALAILEMCRKEFAAHELVRFLDPCGGTGAFFGALLRTFGPHRVTQAVTYEVDPSVSRIADQLWAPFGLEVRHDDFTARPQDTAEARPNLLVCNPPYSRHHLLDRGTKARLQTTIAATTGLTVNGLSGMAAYFMLLAHQHLAPGGLAAWLVPSEMLDVNYGAAIREYLSSRVTTLRVHRFPPEETQFADALVSSCVILLRKQMPLAAHRVVLSVGRDLLAPKRVLSVPSHRLRTERKWGPLFDSRGIARSAGEDRNLVEVGYLFDVRRGIATGANTFFVLESEEARRLGLPEQFLRPVLPSPRHVVTCRIAADADGMPLVTPSLMLLDCDLPRDQVRHLSPALDRYLQHGEQQGLPNRYLLSRRDPWYRQERRSPAPLLCTYMSRPREGASPFRFIRNDSQAITLNVYLMMYPTKRTLRALDRAPDLLDRLQTALAEVSHHAMAAEGREYGGGLHKLEPAELARVMVALSDDDLNLVGAADQAQLPGI